MSAAIPPGQASAIYADDSSGFSNYNALYTTFKTQDYHGVTTLSNFTWGRALGTGNQSQATSGYTALNPYNVRQSMYGPQFFDYKFTLHADLPVVGAVLPGAEGHPRARARRMENRSDLHGSQRRAAVQIGTLNTNDSFGETQNSGTLDGAVLGAKYTGGTTADLQHQRRRTAQPARESTAIPSTAGTTSICSRNPAATFNEFRPCILGYDTSCGANGQIRGMSNWNMDLNIAKDFSRIPGTGLRDPVLPVHQRVQSRSSGRPLPVHRQSERLGRLGSNENGSLNSPRQLTFSLRLKF